MKLEEQVLSCGQMAHLKKLGVDTSDASMCWVLVRSYDSDQWEVNINNSIAKAVACINDDGTKRLIPTYTIGDIVEKLPRYLEPDSKDFERSIRIGADYTKVEYQSVWGEKSPIEIFEDIDEMPTLQVLYKLLCWVAKKHKELIK